MTVRWGAVAAMVALAALLFEAFFPFAHAGSVPSTARNCCPIQSLRVGMPPYTAEPYISWNEKYSNATHHDQTAHTGFVPSIINELAKEMGFTYVWVTLPFYIPSEENRSKVATLDANTLAIDILVSVSGYAGSSDYDLPWARSDPFLVYRWGALVRKVAVERSFWGLFDPFTQDLWGALVCILVALSVFLVFLKASSASSRQDMLSELAVRKFLKSFYHVLAATLGGDDYEWQAIWPGRILKIGLLFLVFIFAATYTANLAAILTKPSERVLGPRDMTQLQHAKIVMFAPPHIVNGFTNPPLWPPKETWQKGIGKAKKWCKEELIKGAADAWVLDSPERELLSDCKNLALVQGVSLSPSFMNILVPWHQQDLLRYFNKAIMYLYNTGVYTQLESEYLRRGETCPQSSEDIEASAGTITLRMMGGTFIISSAVAIFAILLALVRVRLIARAARQAEAQNNPAQFPPTSPKADA